VLSVHALHVPVQATAITSVEKLYSNKKTLKQYFAINGPTKKYRTELFEKMVSSFCPNSRKKAKRVGQP
jgi:hypothetical protein